MRQKQAEVKGRNSQAVGEACGQGMAAPALAGRRIRVGAFHHSQGDRQHLADPWAGHHPFRPVHLLVVLWGLY